MFNLFNKQTKTTAPKIVIPLHIDPSDRSQQAQDKRDELRFEMAQCNPKGFRQYKASPTPRQLKRRAMKRKFRQFAKDVIREDRLAFIKNCEKNGPPYQACKFHAFKCIEARR